MNENSTSLKKLIHNSCTEKYLTGEFENGGKYEIMTSNFHSSLNELLALYNDENLKDQYNFGDLSYAEIVHLLREYEIATENIISFSYWGVTGLYDFIQQIEINDYLLITEGTDDFYDDLIIMGYVNKKYEEHSIKKLISEYFQGKIPNIRGMHDQTMPEIEVNSKHIDLNFLKVHLRNYFPDIYWYNFRKQLHGYSKMSGKDKDSLILKIFTYNKRDKVNIDAFNNVLSFYVEKDQSFFKVKPTEQEFNLLIDAYMILNATFKHT